ncbi:beta-1,2-xylosyltransferase XYXT1-like [Lolium rigidum]|uniref:beta-1,2-xylosyltransferase XYXT1-like n=1 Tax=Lolium rigidum TaxID=89674 RepID=UPI001F5C2025|nr:beta-1,2-xylosyltransferase XYXT1-like [Lolium rigidum]
MKARRNESSKKPRCGGAVAAWLLVPLLVLVVLKTGYLPQLTRHLECAGIGQQQQRLPEIVNLQAEEGMPKTTGIANLQAEEGTPKTTGIANLQAEEGSVAKAPLSPASSDKIAGDGADAIKDGKDGKNFLAMNGEIDGPLRSSDVAAPRSSKLTCDFSSRHTDICAMEGDVRVHGKSGTVYVVAASKESYWPENGTVTFRPFTRKYEESSTMQMVREVTIRTDDAAPPSCTVTHDVPAVVFSTGPDRGNIFHGLADLIIPLYITAREYDGRVQLLATGYQRQWISHYRHLIEALSVYPVIDFDADEAVRCFPSVHVGMETHGELRIGPALSRKGYTMRDFRDFLLSAYSLKRRWTTPVSRSSGERPRLVMVLRRHSREITNEAEAIAAATEIGFEVVAAGPELVGDTDRFAEVVNSCDVLVGVHGAGLTNMVFLPHNGTELQIVPWGELKFIAFQEYGRPLADMGLRYLEYEATAEETTLKDVYAKDHAVFTDPLSIHKQGFDKVWSIFLGQNVTLDIGRFKGVMQQIYQSVTIT